MSAQGVHGFVGLAGFERPIGQFTMGHDLTFRIDLPEFGPDELAKLRRDCEKLATVCEQQPEGLQELFGAIQRGEMPNAVRVAREVGLTEQAFESGGGGGAWLIGGAVLLAIVLWAGDAG